MNIRPVYQVLGFSTLLAACTGNTQTWPAIPDRFTLISDVDTTIQLDIRYITSNNFIGRPIEGYHEAKCILTNEAAMALAEAQQQARNHGYSLKVYDCYRPQRAVNDFVAWAKDITDTKMQHRFYPAIPKDRLFELDYIAAKSGHSRGSTVDLTLVPIDSEQPDVTPEANHYDCRLDATSRYPDNSINMGSGYDCFDEISHTATDLVDESARNNRQKLKSIMEDAGFVNFEKEWWHYTLGNEPFPDTYFDFPVQ